VSAFASFSVPCTDIVNTSSELAELLLMKGRQSHGDLMAVLPFPTGNGVGPGPGIGLPKAAAPKPNPPAPKVRTLLRRRTGTWADHWPSS
jgi:hypothetical protein